MLGENIKKYRLAKGLTQQQVADAVGKSKNVVSNWETGLNKPDADTIELLLEVLDIDANTLLGWNDPQKLKDDVAEDVDKLLSDPIIKELALSAQKLSKEDIQLAKSFIKRLIGKDE